MFCPHKNSYLQLVCAMNPRIINKAVDKAMRKKTFDPHCELPPAQRLESMQPSLYAPMVDVTRGRMGFGRVGLRILNRDLHSKDYLTQLQAIHSIMDQVQISENAIFLINLHVVYRLIDLMGNRNPVIREKVCIILTHLAGYAQGRQRIMSRPEIFISLMYLCLRDKREIRYAAAYTLRTLARDRCACDVICKTEDIIVNLLKMITNDYTGIVLLHLKTLENLIEWDPVVPLKSNAFQVMLALFKNEDARIVSHAMDCMAQLCKHDVGKQLADENDVTFVLRSFLDNHNIEVSISAVGLMCYTTVTTRSKWRAKEACNELTRHLTYLCHANKPLLQLRALQVLINLCDCPDIRYHMKLYWEKKIKQIVVRTHEEWDGTSETTSMGLETGHNYRTMCIEKVETIKNDYGDNAEIVNVYSYLRTVQAKKEQLIRAINWKPWS
ncbi:uncharacterized protein [Choristoneura fumiferana]|uniref:uncharacterized protein n=1 Tax=Choristoneura fumiferana TaxID=7141 RepID=UPI003D15D2F3